MSPLLRSLFFLSPLLLLDGLFFAVPLQAEGPLPLPKPHTNSSALARLQAGFSNSGTMSGSTMSGSGVTHPQTAPGGTQVRTADRNEQHRNEQPGQLTPPRLIRQTSFASSPISPEAELSRESFYRGQPPHDDEYEYEYGYEEEEEVSFNATLDRQLFSRKFADEEAAEEDDADGGGWKNKLAKPALTPLLSIGGSLFIVLAAFFLLAILLRKVSPQGSRPLPKEAFECLGRYFLTQKHQVQVLRMGNRIVLVSVMPDGVSTLAEINDPDEAVAFLGLCRRLDNNSATEMFRKTVASMSGEELGKPPHRPAALSRHREERHREERGQLDLYSDPDESLASILARGRRR